MYQKCKYGCIYPKKNNKKHMDVSTKKKSKKKHEYIYIY